MGSKINPSVFVNMFLARIAGAAKMAVRLVDGCAGWRRFANERHDHDVRMRWPIFAAQETSIMDEEAFGSLVLGPWDAVPAFRTW